MVGSQIGRDTKSFHTLIAGANSHALCSPPKLGGARRLPGRRYRCTRIKVPPIFDMAIVGGGVNGCGIARDAAGRGVGVAVRAGRPRRRHLLGLDQADPRRPALSRALRFRAGARGAQGARGAVGIAPHIVRPLRFVLPYRRACGRAGCCASACSSTTTSAAGSACPAPACSISPATAPGRR